jgi:hypothetical protein
MDGKTLSLILSLLTPHERAQGVAYALSDVVPAGTVIAASPRPVIAATKAYVAFVDSEPLANWGHPARYLLVDAQSDAVTVIDVRFPPFGAGSPLQWQVIYRAPGVPDAAVATPR